jgi:hypothetical protein
MDLKLIICIRFIKNIIHIFLLVDKFKKYYYIENNIDKDY